MICDIGSWDTKSSTPNAMHFGQVAMKVFIFTCMNVHNALMSPCTAKVSEIWSGAPVQSVVSNVPETNITGKFLELV